MSAFFVSRSQLDCLRYRYKSLHPYPSKSGPCVSRKWYPPEAFLPLQKKHSFRERRSFTRLADEFKIVIHEHNQTYTVSGFTGELPAGRQKKKVQSEPSAALFEDRPWGRASVLEERLQTNLSESKLELSCFWGIVSDMLKVETLNPKNVKPSVKIIQAKPHLNLQATSHRSFKQLPGMPKS